MTQSSATQSQPQADGDSRPFTGPLRVVTGTAGPAFGPPASHVLMQRDAAVTALVEPMARMLYTAFQAQHLGMFDDVAFDELEPAAKRKLVDDARVALHLQSPLYRAEADRQAKLTLLEALETSALHYRELNPVATELEKDRRERAMAHAIRTLELVDLANLFHVSHRMALTSKLPLSEQKQVTLTALRGMF